MAKSWLLLTLPLAGLVWLGKRVIIIIVVIVG
jgi:uncharacterized membrane protein YfbV (UPF0208 family)